jgi:hypothetical protein
MENNRRFRLDLNEPAELAIRDAIYEVEKMSADVRLTNAVIYLDKARELVADFIDNVKQVKEEKHIACLLPTEITSIQQLREQLIAFPNYWTSDLMIIAAAKNIKRKRVSELMLKLTEEERLLLTNEPKI